ncbi:Uncharacterised protein [Pseudomonas luteola]|uniref:Uncharacterized protein n=1 Tax=Pseudomonas luteola TaxID=47886 RepID=A0A2X2BY79_PSELU|nr:hypothetical protein [Pseudomonas luteola]SPY99869.1 Uncharacterised protein [Pseudomonas luteola]SPZ00044.1 Uncharacterised protein [Pseudomonas luteola]
MFKPALTVAAMVLLTASLNAVGEIRNIDYPFPKRQISPDLLSKACAQAVLQEQTEERVKIKSITLQPSLGYIASCSVDAVPSSKEYESGETHFRYSVGIDVTSGKSMVTRLYEGSAKEAALAALSEKFIRVDRLDSTADEATMHAEVGELACVISLSQRGRNESVRWIVEKLDCERR